jgi:endoglucanase
MKNLVILGVLSILLITTFRVCSTELSSYDQLTQSWISYKNQFVQADGRVMDFYLNSATTSEGQSYALLRSVWLNDKQTFDSVLTWTNNNLRIRGDNLFAWKWGQNKDGSWGIIDKSSATDAEQDIALALILAYEKWNNKSYLDQAKNILTEIWCKEVINVQGTNYITAGDWTKNDENAKLNPSYFAPYAYRVFAKYDKSNNWMELVDSSYKAIETLSSQSTFNLPPDWGYINQKTGEISLKKAGSTEKDNSTESDFSYDAIRTFWRISMDYVINKDERALNYLNKSTKYLIKYWQINKNLPASITSDGIIRKQEESYAIYGMVITAIGLIDNKTSQEIYHQKIAASYDNGFWQNPKDYYGQNLIWFGLSLWNNMNTNGKVKPDTNLLNLISK